MENKRIHLVDDEPILLELLAIHLSELFTDAQVSTSANGLDALEYLEKNPVDIVVTDLKMPKMNGFGLIKEIVRRGWNIPIILHSSFAETLGQLDGIEAGVYGIVDKPTNYDVLAKEIEKALQGREETPSNFLKLHVSNLMSRKYLPFDLYIRVNGHNFIHMFKKGEDFPRQKIVQYYGKGIDSYYVKREDFLNIEESIYVPVELYSLKAGARFDFSLYTLGPSYCYMEFLAPGQELTKEHCELLEHRFQSQVFIKERAEQQFYSYLNENILSILECDDLDLEAKVRFTLSYGINLLESTFGDFKAQDLQKLFTLRDVLDVYVRASQAKLLLDSEVKYSDFIYRDSLLSSLLALQGFDYLIGHSDHQKFIKEHNFRELKDSIFLGALLKNVGKVHVSLKEHLAETDAHLDKALQIIENSEFLDEKVKSFILSLMSDDYDRNDVGSEIARQLTLFDQDHGSFQGASAELLDDQNDYWKHLRKIEGLLNSQFQ
jgi:CheY-like chemotaxis protein